MEAALEGRKVSLPMIKEFIKRHKRLYGAAVRNFKGFRRVLGGMEYPYSEAYNFLSRVRQRVDINPSELGRQLYSLFCAGEPICLSALQGAPKGSRRRNYSNQICTLAKTDFIGGTGSPTKVISKLTGLSAASIKASIADTKKNSVLAERLVSLVFHWAPLLGIGIGVSGEVYDDSKMRRFEYDGETGYSDLRLGNNAVEVKSYSGELKGGRLEDLIAKYSPTCFNFWDDGEPMERSLVVFYQSDETYARARQRIEDAEIEVMSYKDFYKFLEQVVRGLRDDKYKLVGLTPRPYLDYLLKLDREIIGSYLLAREGNTDRREWSIDMLDGLIKRAKEVRRGRYKEREHSETRLRIPGAKVVRHVGGKFLLVKRDFNEVEEEGRRKYIRENRENLSLSNMRRRFSAFSGVNKNQILAFDLETCGLRYRDPIISVGFATFNRERVETGVLLARDYSEERPLIDYLLEMFQGKVILSYNGRGFDFPRLDFRARSNGVMLDGDRYVPLKKRFKDQHIDLYPLVRKRFKSLQDRRLPTLEKLIPEFVGFERKRDIPSSDIPGAYKDFINSGNGNSRIGEVVEHNLLDSLSLIAVLAYLCDE